MSAGLHSRPPVWGWYAAYCAAMAATYALSAAFAVLLFATPRAFDLRADEGRISGALLFAICVTLFVAFAAGILAPQRPWAWVLGIVLIAFGLMSCCCIPVALPLLIVWTRPATRLSFGVV